MLFADIYNEAMSQCAMATSIISISNEFYDNQTTQNGTIYSSDIHLIQ